MHCGLDVGNSRLKLYRFVAKEGREPVEFQVVPERSFETRDDETLRELRDDLRRGQTTRLHVVSVDPDFDRRWRVFGKVAPNSHSDSIPTKFWDVASIPMRHPYRDGTRLGADRLLAAWAAWQICGRSLIVVDAGTAMTVDCVNSDGAFEGGAIAAGRELLGRALGEQGRKLVTRRPEGRLEYPGEDTESALDAGITAAFEGSLRVLVKQARLDDSTRPLFVTGGDGAYLARLVPELAPRLVEDLVARGLEMLARSEKLANGGGKVGGHSALVEPPRSPKADGPRDRE